jgi:hypothetical protein
MVRDELHAVRAALTDLLKRTPNAAVHVADALQALDRLELAIEHVPARAPVAPAAVTRGRRNQPKLYRVEGRPGHEALCEYRADDPDRPFRCPRVTYDPLAKVMGSVSKPIKFDEIAKRLAKELGHMPALYQLRVALRFWTKPEVGLVEKVRTRYHAAITERFVSEASKAWRSALG